MRNSLLDVKGVGPATARLLAEAGLTDVMSLAHAEPGSLTMIKGIGEGRAASLQDEAKLVLAASDPVSAARANDEAAELEKRATKLRIRAKQLQKRAKLLTKKAKKTKSKKKRKRRLREVAEIKEAAKKARRQAERLLTR